MGLLRLLEVQFMLLLNLPQLPFGLTLPFQVLPCLGELLAPVGHELSQQKRGAWFVVFFL